MILKKPIVAIHSATMVTVAGDEIARIVLEINAVGTFGYCVASCIRRFDAMHAMTVPSAYFTIEVREKYLFDKELFGTNEDCVASLEGCSVIEVACDCQFHLFVLEGFIISHMSQFKP